MVETKIKVGRIDRVVQSMFPVWEYTTNLENHYNGRIWLTWRLDFFKIYVVSTMDQAITCEVLNIYRQERFQLTVVCGHNTKDERRALWDYILITNQRKQIPWLVTGDFNSIMKQDDRIWGGAITMEEIEDFHDCVVQCGLMELPYSGSRYTWSDKQGSNKVWSKIGWALVNSEWLDIMPDYLVNYMLDGVSDHNPIHIALRTVVQHKRKAFKYCNTWSRHPKFLTLVKDIWNQEKVLCTMYQVDCQEVARVK